MQGQAIEPDPMKLVDGMALTLSTLRQNLHKSRKASPGRTKLLLASGIRLVGMFQFPRGTQPFTRSDSEILAS